MADPEGFLTTARQDCARRPVPERVDDWREVHDGQSLLPIVTAQAGRCMDCGIPFCHSSCPLANLIPEWNGLVYREDWDAAVDRLHATNNFPEFTGRLCPAPCETGCVLAVNADPVTIKDVERAIADHAWDSGRMRPVPPGRRTGSSVAVVGSGPAGLAAAQQLTRAGHDVVVYERADRLGGLLRYGIPEFKMEKRHLDRRLGQLRAEGTVFRTSAAVGTDVPATGLLDRHDAVVVATGATAWRELPVPGRELTGIHQAMEYLPMANRVQEGDWPEPPVTARDKDVVIVGGGDTGADCLGTVLRQGAASVVQLDVNPQAGPERSADEPWPVHPRVHRVSPAHEEGRALSGDGDVRTFSAATLRFEGGRDGRVAALRIADAEPDSRLPAPGTERVLPAQLVLLALGFVGPEPDGRLFDPLGLRLGPDGTLARDAGFAAGRPGVFAAGDAARGQSLVVWAIAEGRSAAAAADRYLRGGTELPAPVTPADRPITV